MQLRKSYHYNKVHYSTRLFAYCAKIAQHSALGTDFFLSALQQKWENPLTGWTSSGDALSHQFNSIVNFETKEAAMKWCEKMGWEYEVMAVQRPNPKGNSIIPGAGKIGAKPKSYSDNFSSLRKGTPIWPHPGFEPAAK